MVEIGRDDVIRGKSKKKKARRKASIVKKQTKAKFKAARRTTALKTSKATRMIIGKGSVKPVSTKKT